MNQKPISLFRRFKYDKELIRTMVLELVSKNLVKPVGGAGMPAGMPGWINILVLIFSQE